MSAPVRRAGARLSLTTLLGALASLATVTVVVGGTVAAFLNPLWITFAEERAGVAAITGFTPEQVRAVTGSMLSDVIFGPPDFAARVDGETVLGAAERSHMVDVFTVLRVFELLFGISVLALSAIIVASRRRRWAWRAVARGSGALALFGVVAGIAILLFFDAAFLLFHLIFFPQGNFAFDPRTQRLTQLFPEQLWAETAAGIAFVGLVVSGSVTILARRRAAGLPE